MPQRPLITLPIRRQSAHKGSCGDVLVVAGSTGMSGAAFLASKACLRTGAGLVRLACPTSINAILEVKTICVMTCPLPETPEGTLAEDALEPLRALVPGRDAVAVGPGLSRSPQTEGLLRSLLAEWSETAPPLLLDADGLNAFQGRAADLAPLAGRGVLTPHPGELQRLSGCSREDLGQGARQATLEAFVGEVGVTTLLKGHRTLVVSPKGQVYENETGNPGMATAGSGDVLTGVIACLLAQGLSPFEAASLGAYLHGMAGDIAARTTGWAPLIATDLLEGLIEAIRLEETR